METFYHAYINDPFKFFHHCLESTALITSIKGLLQKKSMYIYVHIELGGSHCLLLSWSLSKKEGMHALLIFIFVKTNMNLMIFLRLWRNEIHVTIRAKD